MNFGRTSIDHIAIPAILSGLLVIGLYFYYRKSREGFAQVFGTLENQRRFYEKCTGDCHRNRELNFSSTFSPMQLTCHHACQDEAEKRSRANLPDLTEKEFQRHTEGAYTEGAYTEGAYAEGVYRGGVYDGFVPSNEGDQELGYCLADIKENCNVNTCTPLSTKNPEACKESCFRVNKYKCFSGLSWSAIQ